MSSYSQKVITSDGKTKTETSKSFHTTSGEPATTASIEKQDYNQKSLTGTDFFKDAYEVSDDKQVELILNNRIIK